ncbi:MAG: hypothetical protein LBS79_04430 [Tannerella sp.]|jgi:hypothetical protein|nr:hypothetical protein [Tannerella sp.]
MKDSEIYPVSFFSQAFDLMQKIQSDFHTLEADQVEMFASQMKKHEALILSIHRQMRNIGENNGEKKFQDETLEQKTPPVATTGASAPVTGQRPGGVTVTEKENVAGQNNDAPKKIPFLNRLNILKDNAAKETEKPHNETLYDAPPETETPPVKQMHDVPGKPVNSIMDDSAELPADRPPTAKRPIRPVPTAERMAAQNPERGVSATFRPSRPTVSEAEKSTITIPTTAKENAAWTPVWPPAGKGMAGVQKTAEPQTQNVSASAGVPPERSAAPSLNDAIEKRILSDLRRAFNVNDRFRYRRELFGGNEEIMNKVIVILNSKESYKDSIRFLEEKLHWDFSNPIVKDFIKVLEIRFL